MKKNIFKKLIVAILVVAFAFTMTSCNRGYGCPNNFSIDLVSE